MENKKTVLTVAANVLERVVIATALLLAVFIIVGALTACDHSPYFNGTAGRDGIDGAAGADGAAGKDGANGTSCTQVAVENGSIITCGDTSVAILNGSNGRDGKDGADGSDGSNGSDGKDGTNGKDGKDAAPTAYSIVKIIDPCGKQASFDEVLLVLASGQVLAHYSDGARQFLTFITKGSYVTTDGTNCKFSLNGDNEVSWK